MKNVLLMVLLVSVFLVGCSSSNVIDQADTGTVPEPSASMSGVTRSFSTSTVSAGTNLGVTLTKTLSASQTSLLVEETVPDGWTIVDAGTGTVSGNTIRWAELIGASSGTYTYTVTAGDTGTWTGQYAINGQEPIDIEGSNTVEVI